MTTEPPNHRILVVDDEPDLRGLVADYLGQHGYAVRMAASGRELDVLLSEGPCDLVLLDVAMPGEDGLSIARRLNAAGGPPVILVTAAAETIDRVIGLEVGADDYITKPFDLRELRARVRAVLRRTAQSMSLEMAREIGVQESRTAHLVPLGRCALDPDRRCLIDSDTGAEQPLTAMEFDLLEVFRRHPNRVLSRDRLLDLAHNRDQEAFDRSIDIRIVRLRRKIEIDPAKPQVIKTVRGAGYIFVPPRDGK